jgi:hypothetical protein
MHNRKRQSLEDKFCSFSLISNLSKSRRRSSSAPSQQPRCDLPPLLLGSWGGRVVFFLALSDEGPTNGPGSRGDVRSETEREPM